MTAPNTNRANEFDQQAELARLLVKTYRLEESLRKTELWALFVGLWGAGVAVGLAWLVW